MVQLFTFFPLEIYSVKDPLPISPFAIKQTHLDENKHNKKKKVRVFDCLRIRVFDCLRTSMRTYAQNFYDIYSG